METWKDVNGYEGLYKVSSLGRIKTLRSNAILVLNNKRGDYLAALLYTEGKEHSLKRRKTHLVHRIVAKAFIPNPENKPQVNHIDGNKHNNRIDNLEWNTRSENMQHCIKNNLRNTLKGTELHMTKLNDDKVKYILNNKNTMSINEFSQMFGVTRGCIEHILWRKTWKHIVV